MSVITYVLVPNDLAPSERRPAILAAHGHGGGKDDVCGIGHGEAERVDRIVALNYDYARQFALRGYVVIAPDWRAFGERRAGGSAPNRDVCDLLQDKALLFGDKSAHAERLGRPLRRQLPAVAPGSRSGPHRLRGALLRRDHDAVRHSPRRTHQVRRDQRIPEPVRVIRAQQGQLLRRPAPPGPPQVRRDGRRRLPDRAQTAANRVGYGRQRLPHRGKQTGVGHGPPRPTPLPGVPQRFDVDEFDGSHEWSGAKAYDWMARWL